MGRVHSQLYSICDGDRLVLVFNVSTVKGILFADKKVLVIICEWQQVRWSLFQAHQVLSEVAFLWAYSCWWLNRAWCRVNRVANVIIITCRVWSRSHNSCAFYRLVSRLFNRTIRCRTFTQAEVESNIDAGHGQKSVLKILDCEKLFLNSQLGLLSWINKVCVFVWRGFVFFAESIVREFVRERIKLRNLNCCIAQLWLFVERYFQLIHFDCWVSLEPEVTWRFRYSDNISCNSLIHFDVYNLFTKEVLNKIDQLVQIIIGRNLDNVGLCLSDLKQLSIIDSTSNTDSNHGNSLASGIVRGLINIIMWFPISHYDHYLIKTLFELTALNFSDCGVYSSACLCKAWSVMFGISCNQKLFSCVPVIHVWIKVIIIKVDWHECGVVISSPNVLN